MRVSGFGVDPTLKELVIEASRSLASLDADRLEELALACRALNRDLGRANPETRADLGREASGAAADLAVFGRVLEATRANLHVLDRLRRLRRGQRGYCEIGLPVSSGAGRDQSHGDN